MRPAGLALQNRQAEQSRALTEWVTAGYPCARTARCPRYPACTLRTHCAEVLTARSVTLRPPNGCTSSIFLRSETACCTNTCKGFCSSLAVCFTEVKLCLGCSKHKLGENPARFHWLKSSESSVNQQNPKSFKALQEIWWLLSDKQKDPQTPEVLYEGRPLLMQTFTFSSDGFRYQL